MTMPVMHPLKPESAPWSSPAPLGVRAVLLDSLGTLVELEPPWVHLAAGLGTEADDRLVGAVRAEMSYYKAHSHTGRDARSLAQLRARCAAILSEELGREVDVETMMSAIRFRPYPDSAPALDALRRRGLRLVCVSNWDCSLPEVLERCDLASKLDGVVTSAGSGSRKPDPAIFADGLKLAGADAEEAIHVGDTLDEDVEGARAAGIRAMHLDRDGGGDIASLAEVEPLLDTMAR
jgi:putative hydrolase of the HAD superfamily